MTVILPLLRTITGTQIRWWASRFQVGSHCAVDSAFVNSFVAVRRSAADDPRTHRRSQPAWSARTYLVRIGEVIMYRPCLKSVLKQLLFGPLSLRCMHLPPISYRRIRGLFHQCVAARKRNATMHNTVWPKRKSLQYRIIKKLYQIV